MSLLRLVIRLLQPGARLYPFEALFVYGCGFWFLTLRGDNNYWGNFLCDLARTNVAFQLAIFLLVVQIPAYKTGIMSNVDVAWPFGLVVVAVQALNVSKDFWLCFTHPQQQLFHCWEHRSFLISAALLLHGLRMAIGALVMFYPYDWPDGDLSRYQYAKQRWEDESSSSQERKYWWIKQQHETLLQAYANSVFVAAPVFLVATNPNPEPLRGLERLGLGGWCLFWGLENLSDFQKILFLRTAQHNGDADTAVLGHAPYDGWKYSLWTVSRHPNYFCEWMCWNSLAIMALPSAMDLFDTASGSTSTVRVGLCVLLVYLSRLFYDCLVYWTGAEPAESRSVHRRPLYMVYQKNTNVLLPISLPGFDHHRTPGWPVVDFVTSGNKNKSKKKQQ